MKYIRPEWRSSRIAAGQRIVNTDEKAGQVLRKGFRTAPRAGGIKVACIVVDQLGGENAGTGRRLRAFRGLRRCGAIRDLLLVLDIAALERHHLLYWRGRGSRG